MIRTATPGGGVATRASQSASPLERAGRRAGTVHQSFVLSLVSSVLLLACGNSDPTIVVLDPPEAPALSEAQLQLVSGDEQEGEVGAFLPSALVVEVTDASGAPFPDVTLEWSFAQGHGMNAAGANEAPAPTTSTVTDVDGRATVLWQLGEISGMQAAFVEIPLPSGSPAGGPSAAPKENNGKKLGLRARGRSAAPDSLSIQPDTATLSVGDSIQLQAEVVDKYGNLVESASVSWTSSEEAVVSASADGSVMGMGAGPASITATSGKAEGVANFVVVETTEPPTPQPLVTIDAPSRDTTVTLGDAVDFQGTASDADGTIVSHAWAFGDGATSALADPGAYTYGSPGSYSVTYQATDDHGTGSSVAKRLITVVAGKNEVPMAAIDGPSQDTTITLGDAVDFQGTASDADGSIASHAWAFGDGTSSSLADPGARTYASAGTYDVTYQATDDGGALSAVATRTVTVVAANAPPTAAIDAPGRDTTVVRGDPVDFRGTASDADGAVASHLWAFGDGTTSSLADPGVHTYASAGSYAVTYRATDDDGATSALVTRTVTVAPPLLAGSSTATGGDGQVLLSASAPTGGTPPYAYQWHRGGSSGFTPSAANAVFGLLGLDELDVTASNGTTYYYKLVATDVAAASTTYAAVSATPMSSGGGSQIRGGPNEPSDYLPIVGREFNSMASSNNDEGSGSFPWRSGGSEGWDDHESTESNLFLSSDASSPLSPPGVMTFRYPAQTVTPGTSFSPGQVQTKNFQSSGSGLGAPFQLQEIYDRWTFKIGPNFQVNDNSGFTKMVFYRGFYDGRLVNGPYIKFGRSGSGFSLEWDLQGTEDNARRLVATGDNRISTDTWYEVEVRLVLNSAPGTADGELHTWLLEHPSGTRTKIFEYTDLQLRGAGDVNSTGYFSSVRHDPVWGGQGGTIDTTFFWHLGHHWTSGKE